MDYAGGFILPVGAVLQRPVEFYGAGAGTIINATAAIPALVRMQDHRRFAFLGIRDVHINLADFHAVIAPVADSLVKSHRIIRRC
jgi:hypothetical protein